MAKLSMSELKRRIEILAKKQEERLQQLEQLDFDWKEMEAPTSLFQKTYRDYKEEKMACRIYKKQIETIGGDRIKLQMISEKINKIIPILLSMVDIAASIKTAKDIHLEFLGLHEGTEDNPEGHKRISWKSMSPAKNY